VFILLILAAPSTGSKDWQRQEEGSASEQGQVHQQDVPPRGLGHHCSQEPEVSLETMPLYRKKSLFATSLLVCNAECSMIRDCV
jgi:hypothetical protein